MTSLRPHPAEEETSATQATREQPLRYRTAEPDWFYNLQGISPRRLAFDRAVTRAAAGLAEWLGRHWLLLVNVALGLFVGIAVMVPFLYALGLQSLGRQIFATYHSVCEQIPSHSYFLLGYQLALCARNLAIYGSLLVGSLAFRFVRHRLPSLDWRLWLLLILPMALDGGTQMFGWRESNWELRTLTGALFGLACCWLALPIIEQLTRDPQQSRQASGRAADQSSLSLQPGGQA